ncbi:hypothetical protein LJC11_04100 [Bacteroidales bacterium OttesenSCG-928-I21]|nr:hypothetical protein [Bacteroidales bacterium OttesenSCG-928-I21]
MVKIFNQEGTAIWDEDLIESFREKLIQINNKYIKEKYEIVFFPIDTILYIAASNKPLMILYQYDSIKGLSIHKICSSKYEFLKHIYLEELADLADEYCRKYSLSKIIFTGMAFYNK